ncbi:MAG: NAD(P)H-dependent oxidoreductase [Lachnospiraceae bacterium]|nr:NAD(P)H-dependent oxidoreductase [Lachnospiraceae bacterium]
MDKILVAYFSASGVTKKLAEKIANVINGDLYEIVPEEPYTSEDLDWENKNSRSTLEMNDRSIRPAIKEKVKGMEDYDVIYLGFPIWWYREPSIIDTFMESYSFTGKKIVPFVTSGGSGLGIAGRNIQDLASGSLVLGGERFEADVTEEELKTWALKWL